MTKTLLFTLATFGTNSLGYRGMLSAHRDDGHSEHFLSSINSELERAPREKTEVLARTAAMRVLKRHGFRSPDAEGWLADPRA